MPPGKAPTGAAGGSGVLQPPLLPPNTLFPLVASQTCCFCRPDVHSRNTRSPRRHATAGVLARSRDFPGGDTPGDVPPGPGCSLQPAERFPEREQPSSARDAAPAEPSSAPSPGTGLFTAAEPELGRCWLLPAARKPRTWASASTQRIYAFQGLLLT